MIGWHKALCFKVLKMNIVNEWRYKFGYGALIVIFIIMFFFHVRTVHLDN